MTKNLPSPITRMSQAMIVLGICAALIVGFVNLRDKPVIQLIEGQLLDWRFILRGPIAVDRNIELVLIEPGAAGASDNGSISAQRLLKGIETISANGARTIVLDHRLLRMSGPGTAKSGRSEDINLARALNRARNVIIPYVFSMAPSKGSRSALPVAIQRTAYSIFRSRDSASVKRPDEAGGYLAPNAELLVAGQPGHVTYTRQYTKSRQFAYPVIGYGGSFYPSLAVQAYRLSTDLPMDAIEINFGESLSFGSLYLPVDNQMRVAVNYHGPGGSYKQTPFADLTSGSLPAKGFEDKLVLVGLAASGSDGAIVTPFDPGMSEVEFLANVIDNYNRMNPLIRSQQVIVLDILLMALIGLFFALVAAARKNWVVLCLATLALALFLAGNIQAFVLFNLWLGLTFPLIAMISCTVVLMATKSISKRRRAALKAAEEEAEETKFAAPWTFDRVANRADSKESEIENAEESSEEDEPRPEEEILTLTSQQEESVAAVPKLHPLPEKVEDPQEEDEEMVEEASEEKPVPDNVTQFTPRDVSRSEPSPLPVPPKTPSTAPAVVSAPKGKEKPEDQTPAQKSKKPASLIPVMESSLRREKVALSSAPNPVKQSQSNSDFNVAVLYINMRGFKTIAKSFGPTRAVQFLHAVYQLIEKTVVKHDGFLEQFGDNDDVMALFGLPEGSTHDAESCLRAARELATALSNWGEKQDFPAGKSVDFCICVDFGPVCIHANGDDDNPDVSLSGYTLGLASRLDKSIAAKGAGVVASETLMAKVRETDLTGELKVGFTEQPMQQIPGAAELVGLWRSEIGR